MHAMRFCTAVAMAAGFAMAAPGHAQDKAKAAKGEVAIKVLLDDDNVRVWQATFKPGDVSTSRVRNSRAVNTVKAGTLERTYPDGKTVKTVLKVGEWRWLSGPETYSVKNIGKTTVVLVVVQPKK